MRVIWNKRAKANLNAIRLHIHQDNQKAAKEVALKIVQAAERLSDMPKIGRIGRHKETRELVISGLPFIVPYRIKKNNTIRILRVIHTAMKWPEKF